MAAAAKMGKSHGMLSIIGLADDVLDDICARVRLKVGGDVVCQTANYLFPTGRVVSGHKDALNEVQASSSASSAALPIKLCVTTLAVCLEPAGCCI